MSTKFMKVFGALAAVVTLALGLIAFTQPGTVSAQAGVAAEIADAALYDELKPMVTHTDILQVFNNLQSASLNIHLPAFQA